MAQLRERISDTEEALEQEQSLADKLRSESKSASDGAARKVRWA